MDEIRSYEKKGYYLKPPKIKERLAFQVGEKLYKTKKMAASKTAWSWILSKYPHIQGVKHAAGYDCDCADYDDVYEYGVQYKHEGCPLHMRRDGYFARLHKKLSEMFLKLWSCE